ncbi:MAG: metallophosphoesterase [Oscillospiraceae bacterium]
MSYLTLTLFAGIAVLLICALAAFFYSQNNDICVTENVIRDEKIPAVFRGMKILQVSDLHNKCFGRGQERLFQLIENIKPDLIFITGDLINFQKTQNAVLLLEKICRIAPVYFSAGNHEKHSSFAFEALTSAMKNAGVHIMRNVSETIFLNGESLSICGIDDPAFFSKEESSHPIADEKYRLLLKKLSDNCCGYAILLSHRPEIIDMYDEAGFDLVFSGHAHGGQFIFPFVGGIFAPNQGLFPKYTSGVHRQGTTALVISRGLGNGTFPIRLFNRPELVVVTLQN